MKRLLLLPLLSVSLLCATSQARPQSEIITKVIEKAGPTNACAKTIIAPEKTRFQVKTTKIATSDSHVIEITLEDIETKEQYGTIAYIATCINTARIFELKIHKNHRKKQYGSALLRFALEKMRAEKIVQADLIAQPFNLNAGETKEVMLPKLIKFYETHKGRVTKMWPDFAEMIFDLKTKQ